MKGKILLVVGIGVGDVLGARAGRERYEDIKRTVGNFWSNPRVQRQLDDAEGFVKDKTPEVVGTLINGAKKVATQVSSRKPASTSSARKSSTKSGSTTAKSNSNE